ncbi:MAG: Pr6Pr family membrane protein [Chryseobacterium sp.]|uniref:Pr6Pr family membrane protein n=1 Tax=Chryseobacterium sp. TaxID=1871047 RepID=UPI0025BA1986|nr:Pr6Pr family membrane protein [Chryseobacterium sp.]MCJ7935495.1 Pr6Pr family membrane protein [Chryseobacterium sp.]
MLETSGVSFWETTIRFFSFFTILTNLIIALYFTFNIIENNSSQFARSGTLTAITVYILIVGLVYQIVLRQTWNPVGLQKVTDELLHSIIPLFVIIYWYLYENKKGLHYRMILSWAVYPLLYLIYILIRGSFSGFYPYPFMNVAELGWAKVLANAFLILIFFIGLSALLIRLKKAVNR